MMEEYLKKGDYVLDVGTGSGILAIAASKLGASKVNAYDIDPVAVRVAQENCDENSCDNVTCGISDLLAGVDRSGGVYDFISANIVADIIIGLCKNVKDFMNPDAIFITSGIIVPREEDVLAAFAENGLEVIARHESGGWLCFEAKAAK
jgi:ribosomal protein L11 methyltransferase